MAPLYGWGSTVSRLDSQYKETVYHSVLRSSWYSFNWPLKDKRMVDLGATQRLWTWDSWTGHPRALTTTLTGKTYVNPLSSNSTKWLSTLNSSAICWQIVLLCLTILWGWHLKGLKWHGKWTFIWLDMENELSYF